MATELTATEQRIAALVARGYRNDEIAVELAMSRRTVEWHLSKVFRKLGVRSRTRLAALILDPGPAESTWAGATDE